MSQLSDLNFDISARFVNPPSRFNEAIYFRCAKSMHELTPHSCDVTELRKCSRCARSRKFCDKISANVSTMCRNVDNVLNFCLRREVLEPPFDSPPSSLPRRYDAVKELKLHQLRG